MTLTTSKTLLEHKKSLTEDVIELRFSKPDGFTYTAGQFAQFHIPVGEKTILRSYSISSIPSDPYLEFCVKLLPDGKGSQFFTALAIGQEAVIQGPSGRFVVDESQPEHVFIATGVGIAPIMGMIRAAAGKKNVRLLFGVRGQEDLFWLDRLEKIQKAFPSFIFDVTLSQPGTEWIGLSGRVTEHLDHLPTNALFYLCGSADMVKDVRAALLTKAVPPQKIRFEIF